MLYYVAMDVFAALAEPTRRNIIEILAQSGQLAATDICRKFQVSPSAISQHLKVLRQARLVKMEKRAQQRIYEINPETMHEVEEWARRLTELWSQRFEALDRLLDEEQDKA
jgi:DNA-binding transcriptional ArsR family regulator